MSRTIFFLVIAALASVSLCSNVDRCDVDLVYRRRMCNFALKVAERETDCNPKELIRLQQRIEFLKGILSAVIHAKLAQNATNNSTNKCPGIVYEGSCFFILDKTGENKMKSHPEAEAACRLNGGTLAIFTNRQLYNVIYNYILATAVDFVRNKKSLVLVWTGASYADGQVYSPNNTRINFSSWSSYHNLSGGQRRSKVALAVARDEQVKGMYTSSPSTSFYPLCQKSVA